MGPEPAARSKRMLQPRLSDVDSASRGHSNAVTGDTVKTKEADSLHTLVQHLQRHPDLILVYDY